MKSSNGFTVIELLVAVGIIGILSAIAIPSYQSSLQKSRRADAQAALQSLANGMERHYTVNSTYLGAATNGSDTGTPASSVYSAPGTTSNYYTFTISAATADTFSLTAAPVTGSGQATDPCGDLSLDNAGNKTAYYGNTSVSECWK